VQCSCHLDVLFDWGDVHNEDLYFLHEVFFFFGKDICCFFLRHFEGNAL
jgi:hypothetical protein